MKSKRFAGSLFVLILVLGVRLDAAQRIPLEQTTRFGYSLKDGALAIDPAVVYVYCPATETLVVHPDHVSDTAEELGAEILDSGEWFIPGQQLIAPQMAKLIIATQENEKDILRNLGTLPVTGIDQVAVAVVADPACQTKLTGYKCKSYTCSGCSSGVQSTGGAVTYCDKTNNAADTCTQTGGFKTCIVTTFQNADCTGSVIQSTTINYNSCQ